MKSLLHILGNKIISFGVGNDNRLCVALNNVGGSMPDPNEDYQIGDVVKVRIACYKKNVPFFYCEPAEQ